MVVGSNPVAVTYRIFTKLFFTFLRLCFLTLPAACLSILLKSKVTDIVWVEVRTRDTDWKIMTTDDFFNVPMSKVITRDVLQKSRSKKIHNIHRRMPPLKPLLNKNRCSPVNIAQVIRTPILKKIWEKLFLPCVRKFKKSPLNFNFLSVSTFQWWFNYLESLRGFFLLSM